MLNLNLQGVPERKEEEEEEEGKKKTFKLLPPLILGQILYMKSLIQ